MRLLSVPVGITLKNQSYEEKPSHSFASKLSHVLLAPISKLN